MQLGQEIEEYREIQQIEYQKKALELALHMNKLQGNNAEVAKLKEQKSKLMASREGIIGKKEQILIENSQQRQQMEHVKTQIYSLESKF